MPYVDKTSEFRQVVSEKETQVPEAKRRKLHTKLSPKPNDHPSGKEYLDEAYTILDHIGTLTRMLGSIRKPYLNVDTRHPSPLSRQGSRNIDLNEGDAAWSNIKHLTNEERDKIDVQARYILQQCSLRIKEMEVLEKRRSELVASKVNPFVRLLPARLRQDESTVSSDVIAAHHSSITWYLNRRLMEVGQVQKDLQTERVKRELERSKTLASGATREAAWADPQPSPQSRSTWLGEASSGFIAATLGTTSDSRRPSQPSTPLHYESSFNSEDEDDDLELSASQILQFEQENAALLQDVQDTLQSVQQAEARIQEISKLQDELVQNLARQTAQTDQLYEDAIATTSTVEKSKAELKKAQQRGKDGRLFLLVFLLSASFSLLFLHYY
ncbi:hypothetical protein FA15DRAFT_664901 [Coprinopsis marcescibilis]|uniref:SNARE-complex protein Syntaxin-18 N-terminal domain-containing protein n=1 Tax=Coprinopsis marcescibilis TaxID=230819 RepID=A0A5C3L9Z0_COPMA|nr:hypothetical protein FA15DRAFT_664901 [Coprinopsis marcescibilis]